jgi:hypothetical protein
VNSPIYFLKSFEEAVGDLADVTEIDGRQTATIGGIRVAVPEDIAARLLPNIGKRTGLLRTDSDFRFKILGRIYV